MHSYSYDFSIEEANKRLETAATPINSQSLRQKNAFLYRLHKGRLRLIRTGVYGQQRPQQVFFAALRTRNGGSELRGRFGIAPAHLLWLMIPSCLLLAGGVALSFLFSQTIYKVIFVAAICLSLAMIHAFFWLMAHFMSMEERKILLLFLENLEYNPPEEETADDTAANEDETETRSAPLPNNKETQP